MSRAVIALAMAALVGLTVGTAAFAAARPADPVVQAVTIGAAAFVLVITVYLLTSDRS